MFGRLVCLASFGSAAAAAVCYGGETPVSELRAECRHGQVFLTWKEAETPAGTTFNVYASPKPMAGAVPEDAERLAVHVEARSARDWWEDPSSYTPKTDPRAPVGWRIADGAPRLDPSGGLFVHTVTEKESGAALTFAVTAVAPDGKEDRRLVAGANVLGTPCPVQAGAPQPICQAEKGKPFAKDAGQGKPLLFQFHGKTGMYKDMNCLFFGDATMGWREGLPFKFDLRVDNDKVLCKPVDRTWIGRKLTESWDARDHVTAVECMWWGYNSNIHDPAKMKGGVVRDYAARRVLGIVRWCQSHLGTDPMATYSSGGSMGGCAGIWIAFHHPEVFAAVRAHVPIVAFTRLGAASLKRLDPCCGGKEGIASETKMEDGTPVLQYLDGVRYVQNAKGDLPFLFISNGRKDGSIPWENNPAFYRALREARQGFAARWDDGDHGGCGKDAPADVKSWENPATLFRYRLDRAYVAFSNCSTDQNPGNGDPKDGDIAGCMNRGLDFADLTESDARIEVTATARHEGIAYPVTADATFRRLQKFKVEPGAKYKAKVGDAETTAQASASGLLTIPGVKIADEKGAKIVVTK